MSVEIESVYASSTGRQANQLAINASGSFLLCAEIFIRPRCERKVKQMDPLTAMNPQAIILAAVAAKSAELAANQVFYIVLIILIILLINGAVLMWLIYKLDKLERIAIEVQQRFLKENPNGHS